jgi:hypothetical protein
MARFSFRSFTCRPGRHARAGESAATRETFAALPSLGRGDHFRRFSPTFGAKVLSQPWGTFAGLALKSGSLSLTIADYPPVLKIRTRHKDLAILHIFFSYLLNQNNPNIFQYLVGWLRRP